MTTPSDDPYRRPDLPAEPPVSGSSPSDQPWDQQSSAVVPSSPPPVPYPQQPPAQPPAPYAHQPYPAYPQPASASSGLYLAAAVLNWVVLAITVVSTLGLGIIAAAWMIPMTVMIHKGAKDGYKHTALAVCTLLFCGLIAGILMLVDEGNRRPKPLA
ncbi:hypothetical protein AAG589_15860 [Isoptericola sp. F-RaC21]|uniref:hypothetical protein n=1 Tax=Isoptericola sp. F-RaC21 TaxID=3141452 RepID=UPI00315C2316